MNQVLIKVLLVVEPIVVILGVSIYWYIRREKDKAMTAAIILGLIDKSKVKDSFKIMAIDMYTKSLRERGFDLTAYAEKYKQKYNVED